MATISLRDMSRSLLQGSFDVIKKTGGFLAKWHESTLWMPMCIVLALFAWVVLSALDRTAGVDMLPQIVALPIKIAYAMAALALTHLVRRRWRMKLTPQQQQELWTFAQAGDKGPLILIGMDMVFSLCALYWLLHYFSA